MKSGLTPTRSSQSRTLSATNSGPLSERIKSGRARRTKRSARRSRTLARVRFLSTSTARHSRVYSGNDRQEPEGLAVVGPGVHEVVAPDVIPVRSPEPDAGTVVQPQPTTFWLFLRHFQSFPPPQSLDSFVIHSPALSAKQRGDSRIAIAAVLGRQFSHAPHQAGFIVGYVRLSSLGRTCLSQESTGSSL